MPGESEIIAKIRARTHPSGRVIVGVGDDAAILEQRQNSHVVACCDLSIEGVHFRLEWATPRMIGRKALAVTLSDVAAMGGSANFAMVSVALPAGTKDEFIDGLFGGLFEEAEAFGISIVGGDTSKSPGPLFIDTTVIGECASGAAVPRSGAAAGDIIFVTGSLGGSVLGLKLLENGYRLSAEQDESPAEDSARRQAILRHLAPEPRMAAGERIGKLGLATAMIDISDGLSTDLGHILEESHCGAIIRGDSIPIADCVKRLSSAEPEPDPISLALRSGEEYELLFTAQSEMQPHLSELAVALDLRITAIGDVTRESGMRLAREGKESILTPSGYEHTF
jgi:thiamine-monophosphate kinase